MALAKKLPHRKARGTKTGIFKSQFESTVAQSLTRQGIGFEYEPYNIPYLVQRNYKPDFVLANGIIIECKGWFESEDQRKMRAVTTANPTLDIRMLFMRLAGKVQGSNMTNAQWCEKYGFYCAEQRIPKDWLYEDTRENKLPSGALLSNPTEDGHREKGN